MQPLTLYGHGPTANPIKVAVLLEELGVPYVVKSITDIKAEPYISVNPNGRLPSIEDPNTGINIFESGAILEYLIETYDKENKFNYTSGQEKWAQKSWLHFQMSGQGPYFGQSAWFIHFHPEKNITSAIDRYNNEIKRVTGVIEAHLKKTGKPYLIGDKLSYVDLAWIPWYRITFGFMMPDWNAKEEFPVFYKWFEGLAERPSFKTVSAKPEFQRH